MEYSANFVSVSDASASTRKVALRLKGKPREDQEAAHLSIILDISGSMDDANKLVNCKRSIGFILDLMRDTDAISLTTFEDEARSVLPLTETKSTTKANIMPAVTNIHTGGCTNMSAGIIEARSHLEPAESTRKQGVLLLTDGHANRGVYDADRLFGIVRSFMDARPGVTFHTVAYGDDHNADLLSKIGEWTGGTYSVVKNLEDVGSVFGSILGTMVSTTAQNVKVYLPANFKLISQLPCEKEGDLQVVRVGDIQSEVSNVILLEVPAGAADQIRLGGYDLLEQKILEASFGVGEATDLSPDDMQNIDFAFLRAEIVDLMKEVRANNVRANTQALLGRLTALETRLQAVPAALRAIASVMEFDVRTMRNILTGQQNIRDYESAFSQHANVYTTARGLTSQAPGLDRNLWAAASDSTPFANRVQSNYVSHMRVLSSQADSDDPVPHSITHNRRVRFSPPLAPSAESGSVSPTPNILNNIVMAPGSPPMTPSPISRITRNHQ